MRSTAPAAPVVPADARALDDHIFRNVRALRASCCVKFMNLDIADVAGAVVADVVGSIPYATIDSTALNGRTGRADSSPPEPSAPICSLGLRRKMKLLGDRNLVDFLDRRRRDQNLVADRACRA